MSSNNEKRKVIELIASSRLIEASKLTMSITEPKSKDQFRNAIIISMELSLLEEAIQNGKVTWEQESTTKNKLALRILKIIET